MNLELVHITETDNKLSRNPVCPTGNQGNCRRSVIVCSRQLSIIVFCGIFPEILNYIVAVVVGW